MPLKFIMLLKSMEYLSMLSIFKINFLCFGFRLTEYSINPLETIDQSLVSMELLAEILCSFYLILTFVSYNLNNFTMPIRLCTRTTN